MFIVNAMEYKIKKILRPVTLTGDTTHIELYNKMEVISYYCD